MAFRKFKQSGFYLIYKFYKNNHLVYQTVLRNKTVFSSRIEAKFRQINPEKVYIKVQYNKADYNDGLYGNLKDTRFALKAFTTKSLINYLNLSYYGR